MRQQPQWGADTAASGNSWPKSHNTPVNSGVDRWLGSEISVGRSDVQSITKEVSWRVAEELQKRKSSLGDINPLSKTSEMVPYNREGSITPPNTPPASSNKSALVPNSTGSLQRGNAIGQLAKIFSADQVHSMDLEVFMSSHGANAITGLTSSAHQLLLENDGPNILTPPPKKSWLRIIIHHYFAGFQLMMLAGALLCFISWFVNPADWQTPVLGLGLVIAVIVTGTMGVLQERQTMKVMQGFMNLATSMTDVIRDGCLQHVQSASLVKGDLVVLEAGQKVPADLRVVEAEALKVDNSPLTGESEALKRTVECTHESMLETKNVAFSGCFFVEGKGKGIVFETGDRTYLGRIAAAAAQATPPKPTLQIQLTRFVRFMSAIAIGVAILFVILGVILIKPVVFAFIVVLIITGIIANVPEGLLPQLMSQLVLTATRMKSKNVLVKELQIIETLGCTSCIASDKTGTLTMNKMSLAHLLYDMKPFRNEIVLPNETGMPAVNTQDESFQLLLSAMTVCSTATFIRSGGSIDPVNTPVKGDASETGLLRFCQQQHDVERYRKNNPCLGHIPFNSFNKWSLTINHLSDKQQPFVFMKGALERILPKCATVLVRGKKLPMMEHEHAIKDYNEQLASKGERVLAICYTDLNPHSYPSTYKYDTETPNFPMSDLTFLGLMTLMDPPRPSVPPAIRACQGAGIKVIMVTGDHPATARAIAKMIGIMPSNTLKEEAVRQRVTEDRVDKHSVEAVVVHGLDELPQFTDQDWDYVLSRREIVFARTVPQQKKEIVERLQKQGHIVAVTGDGTNDTPALKQAACGVAMGISGTEIAREAAQLILLDDNFSSLVAGIEEGRLIFVNMQKCVFYTLTHLVPEVWPFLLYLTLGVPLAMETIIVLAIDLGTELLPSISLAWETPESALMEQPPRNPYKHGLVSWQIFVGPYIFAGMIESFFCFWAFFWCFWTFGFPLSSLWGIGQNWAVPEADLSEDDIANYAKLETENVIWRNGGGRGVSIKDGETWFDYRQRALDCAQASYFWALVLCQMGLILVVKTVTTSMFTRKFFFNKWMAAGLLLEVFIVMVICYVPGIQLIFGTQGPPAIPMLLALPGLPVMIILGEIFKFFLRLFNKRKMAARPNMGVPI